MPSLPIPSPPGHTPPSSRGRRTSIYTQNSTFLSTLPYTHSLSHPPKCWTMFLSAACTMLLAPSHTLSLLFLSSPLCPLCAAPFLVYPCILFIRLYRRRASLCASICKCTCLEQLHSPPCSTTLCVAHEVITKHPLVRENASLVPCSLPS